MRLGYNSPVDGVYGRTDTLVVWQTAGQASGEGGAGEETHIGFVVSFALQWSWIVTLSYTLGSPLHYVDDRLFYYMAHCTVLNLLNQKWPRYLDVFLA